MITQFFAGNYCSLFKAPFVAAEGALGGSCSSDTISSNQHFACIWKCNLTFSFGIISCNILPHSHSAECELFLQCSLRTLIQHLSTGISDKFKMYLQNISTTGIHEWKTPLPIYLHYLGGFPSLWVQFSENCLGNGTKITHNKDESCTQ